MDLAPPNSEADVSRFRGHPVQLPVFEGPLDLLLHLLKRDRLEIWQISISRITGEYLSYLAEWQSLNIEVAGDFLVMAATLMRMKSQMMLPRPSFLPDEDDGEEPFTREKLIERLLEYRRIREAAQALRGMEQRTSWQHPRGEAMTLDPDFLLPLRDPKLFDLVEYLRDVMEDKPAVSVHQVQLEEYRLEDQIEWIESCLRVGDGLEPVPMGEADGIRFSDLLRRPGARGEVVVSLLAILELAKLQRLRAWQIDPLSEIWLIPVAPNPEAYWGEPAIGA